MSKELKERVVNKAHAAVEGVVNKAHAVVEEIALQVVQDEVESPNMLGIDNARFLYEVGMSRKRWKPSLVKVLAYYSNWYTQTNAHM